MGNNRISGTTTLDGSGVEGAKVVVFRITTDANGNLDAEVADVVETDANGDYQTDILPERDEWHAAVEFESDTDGDGTVEQYADLSKPFVTAGPHLRQASGTGTGSGTTAYVRIRTVTASGQATGSGVAVAVTVNDGVAAGSATGTGSVATADVVNDATAAGTGVGTGTVVAVRIRTRSASGSTTTTGTVTSAEVLNDAVASGAATGAGTTPRPVRIRTVTVTASGVGTGSTPRPVRIRTATATGSGIGTGAATGKVVTEDLSRAQMLARRHSDHPPSRIEVDAPADASTAQTYGRRAGGLAGREEHR